MGRSLPSAAKTGLDEATMRQADAVVQLVRTVLAPKLVGVYLHGSAVVGGLRPRSDLDILAVTARRTSIAERRRLVGGLLRLSGRRARPPARPVELTVVRQRAVRPWRYPARSEFQYGDWLRDEYEGGFTPGSERNPDLAILVFQTLHGGRALFGPPPGEILDLIPQVDVVRAGVAGIPGLLADLESDTTNVLLTLARVWVTAATGAIRTKDGAADWAAERVSDRHRSVLVRARGVYLGHAEDAWEDLQGDARVTAEHLIARIRAVADESGLTGPEAVSNITSTL